MKSPFKTFGVMIDMSRNAVMTTEGLKDFMRLIRKMGYNSVMLYTEDTYEVEDEPYFGYMRGRYTMDEMRELDNYAASIGIELIPCIQTLAHLNAIFRWRKFEHDWDDILLVDSDRTYELIERMISTLRKCFSSKRIHVGMDEAFMLGRGHHQDKFGPEDTISIMKRHLGRVCDIARRHDFEVMMWSDMFFSSWNNRKYFIPKCEMPKDVIDSIPEGVTPVYWDYFHDTEEEFAGMIENHKQLSKNTCFAGGAWSWLGFIPFNRRTLDTMRPAFDACKKHGVDSVFLTMWGDDGAECSKRSLLPSLYYLAEYARGNRDEENIKRGFMRFSGIDFDRFMQIDSPNDILGLDKYPKNPSKYMLYSDYFNGFLDYTIKPEAAKKYAEYAENLDATAKSSRKYGYIFKTAARLCRVLEIKYSLGYRTREAYLRGDKETLRQLAENEYREVERRIRAFASAFSEQWMRENKPHGFDVQDMRLGGLIHRTAACRKRIIDYVNGKTDKIDELCEQILPFGEKETSITLTKASVASTVNVV